MNQRRYLIVPPVPQQRGSIIVPDSCSVERDDFATGRKLRRGVVAGFDAPFKDGESAGDDIVYDPTWAAKVKIDGVRYLSVPAKAVVAEVAR